MCSFLDFSVCVCLCVYAHTFLSYVCVLSAWMQELVESRSGCQNPLELEIQRLDNSHMGARNLPLPPPYPLQNH